MKEVNSMVAWEGSAHVPWPWERELKERFKGNSRLNADTGIYGGLWCQALC